jgi:hypothetical protein
MFRCACRALPIEPTDFCDEKGAPIPPLVRFPCATPATGAWHGQSRSDQDIIGVDGVHVGTVDRIEGERIKRTKSESASHSGHHHYISAGLVAEVEVDTVRLSAKADAAVTCEEEKDGEGI